MSEEREAIFLRSVERGELRKFIVGSEPYRVIVFNQEDVPQNVGGAFTTGVYALWLKTHDPHIPEWLAAGMLQALTVDPDRNRAVVCVCDWVSKYFYEKRSDHHKYYDDLFELDLTAVVAALKPMIANRERELRADTRWFGVPRNSDTGLWGPLIRSLVQMRDKWGGPDLVPAGAEPLLKKAR